MQQTVQQRGNIKFTNRELFMIDSEMKRCMLAIPL